MNNRFFVITKPELIRDLLRKITSACCPITVKCLQFQHFRDVLKCLVFEKKHATYIFSSLSNTHEKSKFTLHIFGRKVKLIVFSLDELRNGQIACR